MKTIILKISIVPLLLLTIIAFANFQPGNGKDNKGNKEKGQSRGNSEGENKKENKGRGNDDKHQPGAGQSDEKHSKGKEDKNDRKESHANSKSNGAGKSDDNHPGNGKSHKETIHWVSNDILDWNLANFPNRKHPKDQKKVTICHQTGNAYPVNITISENALQAHLKHGDQVGSCNVNFGSWPENYIKSRETVYTSYENTWENMSYSEALLKIALDKLLGIKTDLNQNRARLSAQEIQRRELLIMDLQNNTNSLDNQIGVTRQALNGININIQL